MFQEYFISNTNHDGVLNTTQVREEIFALETLFFTLLGNCEAENDILLHPLEGDSVSLVPFQHPICLSSFWG